jgi:hypothetical protein
MKLVEVFNEKLNLQNDIQSASLLSESEIVILTNKGEMLLYNYKTQEQEALFDAKKGLGFTYSDGGFDPSADSSIYTMDDIIVVVNNYKKHGYVLNRKESYLTHFSREDYHAEISKYPVALFKNENDEPHLIYAVAWNHIQIVNLCTRQVLTAAKSLIEDGAEQRHIDFYKKYEENNKLFWPNGYDYFFGKLSMSPNMKKFISAGWVWGSFDACDLYDVEDFISNPRIKVTPIHGGEHMNRAVCFVDNETVAVVCNPCLDDEEGVANDSPYEIRLYHADGSGEKNKLTLKTSLDLSDAELFYHQTKQCFYTFSEKIGTAIISLTGDITFHAPDFVPQKYDERHNQFIRYDGKQFSVYDVS